MYRNPEYPAEIMPIYPHGTNSTMFTDCCRVAICNDEKRCPKCNRLVIGHDAKTPEKRGRIRWENATKRWSRTIHVTH